MGVSEGLRAGLVWFCSLVDYKPGHNICKMKCMRRRQPKGVNFQDTAIVLSCFLILAFLSLFSYCFYFVYTEATITKSLNLNKTFLGRFHLTRYLSLACVQLISGTFL